MKTFNNFLKKYNFNMNTIKLFDSFAGIGALHQSLKELGIPVELIGMSEIDIDAIISYGAVHNVLFNKRINLPSEEEMRQYLIDRNIGYDFKTGKSKIPRLKKDKLIKCYQVCVATNNYGDISKLKYEDIEDFDLFNFSFPCFKAGTLVMTEKGYIPIEDIKAGDKVLTHTNKFQKVVKPMVNKANKIYNIKAMCCDELEVTEEHPFYVRTRYREWDPSLKKTIRKFGNPKWVKTKDLTKDDYLGIAINQKSKLPDWDGVIVNSTYSKRGNKKLLNNIKNYFNNEDFWWIVGRYMGDGWVKNIIDYKGTDIYDLYICCAKDELKEITTVLNKLNKINNDFHYRYYEDRTVYRIRISNVEFAKFLQQFGKYAYGKRLTSSVFDLPKNLLKSFLQGYISADGCFTQSRYKCSSVSKELIYGIGQCVAKAYNTPFSIYHTKRKPTCVIEDRVVNQRNSYECCFKLTKDKQDKSFYEDGYIWSPINKIRQEEYDGLVYNMEVENDNSYTANGIIVHNCTDLSVAGKQEGMSDKEGNKTRSGLCKDGIELIKVKKPKFIMIENVKNLIGKKFIKDFYDITNEIESFGYKCHYPTNDKGQPKALNAKNFGIPQNRERIYVICIRNDVNLDFEFPKELDDGLRLKDILEDEIDEKYYLKETKNFFIKNSFDMESKGNGFRFEPFIKDKADISKTITTRAGSRMDDNFIMDSIDDYNEPKFKFDSKNKYLSNLIKLNHDNPEQILVKEATKKGYAIGEVGDSINLEQPNSKTRRGRVGKQVANTLTCSYNQGVVEGKNEINVVGNHSPSNHNASRIVDIEGIAPTVMENHGTVTAVNTFKIRKLTPKECWRLMGFRDECFDRTKAEGVSDSQLYKQAGNSIVVNVLYYIFLEIFKKYIVK